MKPGNILHIQKQPNENTFSAWVIPGFYIIVKVKERRIIMDKPCTKYGFGYGREGYFYLDILSPGFFKEIPE